MKVKVNFPNGTYIIVDRSIVGKFFENANISTEDLPEDFDLSAPEIRRHNNAFSSLVGAIDAKWGYSYEPLKAKPQPYMAGDLRQYMDNLIEQEYENDYDYNN